MPLWSSGCSAGSSPGRLARRPSDACRGPGRDSELSFQNGILPAFLPLPPPRLCNEPFPPGRYFRVLAGGIYIYKLVSYPNKCYRCDAVSSSSQWYGLGTCVHTCVCALGTVIYTCLFTCASVHLCAYLSSHLSVHHPSTVFLSYIYKLSLLA